jgi:hypothetical protein
MCRPFLYALVALERIRKSVELACADSIDYGGAADQKRRGGRQQRVDRVAGDLQDPKQTQHDHTHK